MGVTIDVDLEMRPMSVDLVFPKGIEEYGRVGLNFWRSSCKYGTLGEVTERTTDRSLLGGNDVAIVRKRSAPEQFDRTYACQKIKVSSTSDGDVQCYLSDREAAPNKKRMRMTPEEDCDLFIATTETVRTGTQDDGTSPADSCDAWNTSSVPFDDTVLSDGEAQPHEHEVREIKALSEMDSGLSLSKAGSQPVMESLPKEQTLAKLHEATEQQLLPAGPLSPNGAAASPASNVKGSAPSIKNIMFACSYCSYKGKDKETTIQHCKTHIKGSQRVIQVMAKNGSSQASEVKQSQQSAPSEKDKPQGSQNKKPFITSVFSLSTQGRLKMTADTSGLILADDSKKFRVMKMEGTGQGTLFTAVPLKAPATSSEMSTSNATSQPLPVTSSSTASSLLTPPAVSQPRLQGAAGGHPRSLLKRPAAKAAPSTSKPATAVGSPKVLFKCFKCDHQTFDRAVALQHLNSHTVEKKPMPPLSPSIKRPAETYTCGKCGKTFRVKNSYMRHMRRHANPNRYECTYCSRCFNNGSSLKVHLRIHTQDYPFKCDMCTRGYMTEGLLLKHKQQTHSDPVVCNQCNLPFMRERNLIQHMIRNHGHETGHKCEACGSFFGEEEELSRHKKKCGKPPKEDTSRRCLHCSFEGETYPDLCTHVAQCHPSAPTFKCSVCNKVFVHSEKLKVHAKSHKKEGRKRIYKCPKCSKELHSQSGLQAHLCSHNSIRPFKCVLCDVTLTSKGNMRLHMMNTHGSKEHTCDQCPKVCTSKITLRRHVMKMHSQTLSHECDQCHKRFTDEQRLQKHMALVHMGDTAMITKDHNPFPLIKPFSCDKCDFTTFSPYKSKAHKIMHTGVMPYHCSECGKSFVVQDELTRHNALCHSSGGGVRPCPHCKRVFIAEQRFTWHLKLHEMGGGFSCEVCGFLYESRAYLEHHMQSHSSSSAFKCNLCDRTFKVSRALTIHKFQSHPETRKWHTLTVLRSLNNPHGCDQCLMRFKTTTELKAHKLFRHLGIHPPAPHTVKRIPCTYCDRKFAYPSELMHHLRIHTGEKPYTCGHCGKSFRYSHSYRNHITVMHTKDFKVHCPFCKKGLVDNTKLKQHLKSAHKAVGEATVSPSAKKRFVGEKSADVQESGPGQQRRTVRARKKKTQQQAGDKSTIDTENAVALLTSLS